MGLSGGVEGVFDYTKGVVEAISGYAVGTSDTATYDQVSNGTTGPAEVVRVTYDPAQITLDRFLDVYFKVVSLKVCRLMCLSLTDSLSLVRALRGHKD